MKHIDVATLTAPLKGSPVSDDGRGLKPVKLTINDAGATKFARQ